MQSLKTIEQLALKSTDITAITPKVIAKFVEEAARPYLYGRQLLRLNTQLEKTQGTSVHLPLRGTASVYRINELTEPTLSDVSFSTTEVTPFKLGAQMYISQEAINAGQVDVINGSLTESGIAIAQKEDTEIFNELLGRQPDPTQSGGIWTWSYTTDNYTGDGTTTDFTLSYNPAIQVDSITDGGTPTTAYTCDYARANGT
jgi:HK97 family phage major capsid protein